MGGCKASHPEMLRGYSLSLSLSLSLSFSLSLSLSLSLLHRIYERRVRMEAGGPVLGNKAGDGAEAEELARCGCGMFA